MQNKVTIRDIEIVSANITGENFTIIKLLTNEPEIYGFGCATFSYRNKAVELYIKDYILPLISGRCVDDIEDLWHLMTKNSYFQGDLVGNHAISAIDTALWDIKGKLCGMSVYDLLGGNSRKANAVYKKISSDNLSEILENIDKYKNQGYNHFEIDVLNSQKVYKNLVTPANSFDGKYISLERYMNDTLQLFLDIRSKIGNNIELIHNCQQKLTPIQSVAFVKELEKYKLYFVENALSLENLDWFETIREQTTTPLAIGSTCCNSHQLNHLIINRLVDYIRIDINAIGGLTQARKLAIFSEQFAIRIAPIGNNFTSPLGQTVNAHLGTVSHNFAIQEWSNSIENSICKEIFIGLPEFKNGYIYTNEKNGFGVDINMESLKKYPATNNVEKSTQNRYIDGTICVP